VHWKNVARSFVKEYGASSMLCKRTIHRILKKFHTIVFVLRRGGCGNMNICFYWM
jgi:hypothetical protein